jgi:hypothetical protein
MNVKAINTEKNEYFSLLKEWCDRLLSLQVTQFKETELYGGIMCPSCGRIHGRCADAIYPMMFMADVTKEDKYITCAKRLFTWSNNMLRKEGSYYNDTNSDWKGITVFFVIQLGETLLHHSSLLDKDIEKLWTDRLMINADYLMEHIEELSSNVNYPVTCAYAMAVAGRVSGNNSYYEKGKELAYKALGHFTEEGLLFGEGKAEGGFSPKMCRPVDIGYNVEESLPALLSYGIMMEDQQVKEAAVKALKSHLEFMLPDGGWDNSWGTRNNKWTYWGSRTSDGCQPGYGLLSDLYPEFGEAVKRNTRLMRECTHDGLLYGGPMYDSAGEPACVHHTFCHAKALAALMDQGWSEETMDTGKVKLPSELRQGVLYYPSVHVHLIGKGPWRGTISDYDVEYSEEGHGTGGALTLLWHESLGPVFTGTMGRYYLVEPNNMQFPRKSNTFCLTPRLEYVEDEILYRNINDKLAKVESEIQDGIIIVTAKGKMVDYRQQGDYIYEMKYSFSEECFVVETEAEKDSILYLPLIARSTDRADAGSDGKSVTVSREQKGKLQLQSDELLIIEEERLFHPVGGMEAILCYIQLKAGQSVKVECRYFNE